jgi:hypothetical protein
MSTHHTPGPWKVVDGHYPSFKEVTGPSFKISVVMWATDLTEADYQKRNADLHLIAAAPELKGVAENFEISGPDLDGLVWLILHGNGTTGKAMFNLGKADHIATRVALELEKDRRAAIAKATGAA